MRWRRFGAALGVVALVALLAPAVAPAALAPARSFDSIGGGPFPPADPNIDVSATQVVAMTNDGYAVHAKDGTLLRRGTLGSLFADEGDACELAADGDPIVIHDRPADRWLLSFFSISSGTGSWQCIAVSETPDALGPYHRYAYRLSTRYLHDYPKLVAWGDSYLLATYQFDLAGDEEAAVAPALFAFDRARLLAGDPGRAVRVPLPSSLDASVVLPAHADETVGAPAGAPAYVLAMDDRRNRLDVLRVAVTWPAGTVGVAGPFRTAVARFDGDLCGDPFLRCIPQPRTSARLDAISDRLLWRVQFHRRPGGIATVVASHTVQGGADRRAGVRWYALEPSGDGLRVVDQGTHAPSATSRFMGSAAINDRGELAIGFSVSGRTSMPGIRFAARRPTDPPGRLGLGEGVIVSGVARQTRRLDARAGRPVSHRWGDYSSLVVDPVDGCTFWYANQYLRRSDGEPRTRIAAFRLPGCAPPAGPDTAAPANPPFAIPARTVRRAGRYRFRWPGAADDSGVDAYSVAVSRSRATLPDAVPDTAAAGGVVRLRRGTWYVHVRARDRAGNWAATATTAGPFRVR